MPTVDALSAGTKMNSTSMRITGAMDRRTFLEINTTARPPNNAGSSCENAGAKTGEDSSGVSGTMSTTPTIIISVVTMLDTAMAMVEMISPSSLLDLTPARSIASRAQGSLRFEILPVTNDR